MQDLVDIVPVAGGEARGNIDSSWAAAVISENTINFDTLGAGGLKLDASVILQTSELTDPFTGERRQWSGFATRRVFATLRHDIPDSDWAWQLQANHEYIQPSFRSNQIDRQYEGPWFLTAVVENKDVFGLTVAAGVANLLGARSYRDRTVYAGLRTGAPVLFAEERDRLIGPIFVFSVRGDF